MSKNEFLIDSIENDDADLEDLRALKKVKDEISKKKRALKDKDYLNKHPDLEELVQKHRRKKISVKEPEADTEAEPKKDKPKKVELEVKETPAKLSWKEKKSKRKDKPAVVGFDYDQLADRIAAKMARAKPKKTKKLETIPEKKGEKEGEAKFNQKLDSIPERVIEPQKTVVASNGKWF